MSVPMARLGDVSEQVRGVTYGKEDASDTSKPGFLPVLRAGNITDEGLVFNNLVFVPAERISGKQRVRRHDVLVVASSGSLDVVGKAAPALADFNGGFGAFCKVLRPNSKVDPAYLAQFLKTPEYRRRASALAAGININNLRNEHLDEMPLPLPPLPEQRRIAEILDQAEALRTKRRVGLAHFARLSEALFVGRFGDPAANPKQWPTTTVGQLATRFSDGPFGSNLKSSHYTDAGVRVIRLQNIGVGEFLDHDRAFISEAHFEKLKKHECRPGDVLVGTLGDPNLRACIQPEWLKSALNKADCVQLRCDERVSTAVYVCALLNHPSTERMAHDLILGQTRLRVSMGRLRGLRVPLPPLGFQQEFAREVAALRQLESKQSASLTSLDRLFASLQQRAFRGEL